MDEIYVIVDISEIDSIDYSQFSQSSPESIRRSLDNTMFILSYCGDAPSAVYSLVSNNKLIIVDGEKYFTHDLISVITLGDNWLDKNIIFK